MSIILDALKKAEKERNTGPVDQRPVSSNPFKIEDHSAKEEKDSVPKNKKSSLVLLVIAIIALGGTTAWRVLHKPSIPSPPKPIAAYPKTPSSPMAGAPANPENAAVLEDEAMKAFADGEYETSRQHLEKLTLLKPTDPEIYNNLGVVFKKLGLKNEADEAYRKALGLNPDYPEALNNRGVLLMEDQIIDQAETFFVKATQLKSDYAEPYFHLAIMFESGGKYDQAILQYESFLKHGANAPSRLKAQVELRLEMLKAEVGR